MKIGCPKEIKNSEYRMGLIPSAVKSYVTAGHEVYIQKGAGLGPGIPDDDFTAAGAVIVDTAEEIWARSDMIVKVKEPLPPEYGFMRPGQIIYTYFHFAADEQLTRSCMERGVVAVAYETVQEHDGSLPLLKPMSEVAGRMAPIMGAYYLAKVHGGRGLLATGVPGVSPASVAIIGGGAVGANAARVAAGFGAKVTIMDIKLPTLEHLSNIMSPNVFPVFGDSFNLERAIKYADMVIGAVLIPGARAPKLITRDHLRIMKPGAVFIDVAIDQGGCAETSRPTTHSDPVYIEEDVLHYCVANMPGAYARTSTFALNNATIGYGLKLANLGVAGACLREPALLKGLNMYEGKITCLPVAQAFGLEEFYKPAEEALRV